MLEFDSRHVGEVLSIPEGRLKGKKWAGIQFARADVTRERPEAIGRWGKFGFRGKLQLRL